MLILGIESSCDETGVALFDTEKGLLSHRLHSQVEMHTAYGGVVPELASRDHIRRVLPLIEEILQESGRSLLSIDAIGVTQGPGLGGALLVGNSIAVSLGAALNKAVVGIHHLEGHLLSPLMVEPRPAFPFIALLVSGGHTQLMAVRGVGDYQLLGETVDDAAGEAFDKTASLLGLGYPGGASLSKLAERGNVNTYKLPRPMLNSGDLEFSFSGLKTAVLVLVKSLKSAAGSLSEQQSRDIAASFEMAIADVLTAKTLSALAQTKMRRIVVAGGVGANRRLREMLTSAANASGAEVFYPPLALCTDNGAMIAFATAMRFMHGAEIRTSGNGAFGVKPRWPMTDLQRPPTV